MKKIYLLLLFLLFINSSYAQVNNYENGDTVNDFTVVDVYGNTHNLYTYTAEGKYVFLDFFYSDCGGCQNFISVFNEFYDKYGCNEGEVVCLAINSGYDKDAAVIDFENTYGGTYNHAPAASRDGGSIDVNDDFDPIYYPACVLIGPDNTIINDDIHPIDTVADLEAAFPTGFNPQPMNCSLSTEELDTNLTFSIYPNPCNGKSFSINMNKSTNTTIIIYNILGEKVFISKANNSIIELKTDLKSGTYLVSIQTKKYRTVQKLIVQ